MIKPSLILVKSKEVIARFKRQVYSWYSYTFNQNDPPYRINNYQQFIKKYIEFHTRISRFVSH